MRHALATTARHAAPTRHVAVSLSQRGGTRPVLITQVPMREVGHLPARDGYTWHIFNIPATAR